MKKIIGVVSMLVLFTTFLRAQSFDSSYLPIVVIETNNQSIPDEPKITAHMKIIENDMGLVNRLSSNTTSYDGPIGIEKRGQTSQLFFPKLGYGIETRNELGEDSTVVVMGMPEESDWVINSPYSDKSLIRNALAYTLAGQIMAYAPRVQMAELVLNGDYKGVILWTEKIKRDNNRVDISKLTPDENDEVNITGGYILRFDKNDPGEVAWESPYRPSISGNQRTRFIYHYPKKDDISPQQLSYIRDYITQFENALMGNDYTDPINGYEPFIDVSSFVQTIIINELSRNVDGYRLSTYMYKDKGGKLAMGPTWDHNLSFGNADYCNGFSTAGFALDFNEVCPQDFWINHVWWKRLMSHEKFKKSVKDLWQELRRDIYSDESLLNLIDDLSGQLGSATSRNFQRWPVIGQYVWPNQFVGSSYLAEINYLKGWIVDRAAWLDTAFGALTTSTDDLDSSSGVLIYPNPSDGLIQLEKIDGDGFIEVFNIAGEKIHHQALNSGTNEIDLRSISNGFVFYRITTEQGKIATGKLMLLSAQ